MFFISGIAELLWDLGRIVKHHGVQDAFTNGFAKVFGIGSCLP